MNPLFTLFTGIAVGVMGVRLLKSSNLPRVLESTALTSNRAVRTGLNQAGSKVRGAAVLGLQAIEQTSAALQRKLNTTPPEKDPAAPEEMSDPSAAQGSAPTPETSGGKAYS